jgi:hypothetical protein
MKVRITFLKHDQSKLSLDYRPFDLEHSQLWIKSIASFIAREQILDDTNRVYNFNDYDVEIQNLLDNCNSTINQLNDLYSLSIPVIRKEYLQDDVNFVHTFFVDADRQNDMSLPWIKLNDYLHGLEIIERRGKTKFQGQVFCTLPDPIKYPIPNNSYSFFTTKKNFGYCYANYPHVGRHILEMYNARDEDAHDDHVLPQHKIAGDFYLWFGNNTSDSFDAYRMNDIEHWFKEKQIDTIVNMQWGDPRLAIGWLPVAEIDHTVETEDLIGLCKIQKIEIIE